MAIRPPRKSRSIAGQNPARRFPPVARDAARLVMRYAVRDYAIESVELGREQLDAFMPSHGTSTPDLSKSFHPLSDASHYRMDVVGPDATGTYEFCGLADGFFIYFGDVDLQLPLKRHISAPDMLRVRVASHGDGEYVSSHGAPLSLEAPNTTLIIEPTGQPAAETSFSGRGRFVHVFMHRAVLKALFATGEHELPPILQTFIEGALSQTIARALPLDPALLRSLEEVHACQLDGYRRRLFLNSRAVDITCQAIEALERSDGFGTAKATRLTERGVLKAQSLLSENFAAPPSLETLAQAVGLSRSALCSGFRQMLGRSVFDYIHDLRMEHALAMLNRDDISIAQVAYAVGYNRTSSFSVAVQRHFGASPTELRRRNIALPI